MGEKVQLGDHGWVDRVLPWFVNNTLDVDEQERVRRHLDCCDACRAAVSLLSTLQSTLRHTTATPMVPPARTERLLATIDNLDGKHARSRRLTVIAVAASLAVALVVGTLVLSNRQTVITEPVLYETVTSPASGSSMDYVLDVQFEPGVTFAAQERLLRNLDARDTNRSEAGNMYRITVNLRASSLEELEQYKREVESLREIRSVTVVAVQLPVKRKQ